VDVGVSEGAGVDVAVAGIDGTAGAGIGVACNVGVTASGADGAFNEASETSSSTAPTATKPITSMIPVRCDMRAIVAQPHPRPLSYASHNKAQERGVQLRITRPCSNAIT
jgi:hypothetical protein